MTQASWGHPAHLPPLPPSQRAPPPFTNTPPPKGQQAPQGQGPPHPPRGTPHLHPPTYPLNPRREHHR